MATRTRKKAASIAEENDDAFINAAREIQRVSLEEEVETSFLSYAYSVIYDRALPDARDGLLPVQRRILYTMYENGYTPDKPHVKSAKVVGAVIGTYHPHGDAACYGSMVRLAQPFSLRLPLVEPHGNFGDQPGAVPAASRYTEARMSKASALMLDELKEDTVDLRPNYDNSTTEPVVLPTQFPNLLINGASGIGVGMATNMPTHNPGEVMDAARWLLTHPNATLEKLMEFLPGPDFNTGGQIIGEDAIKAAYTTGRGIFRVRGRYNIEDAGRGKHRIVFYELPVGVSSEGIIEKIKAGIDNGRLVGIADVKDLTDRKNGTRLVIETKTGINPKALVASLFKYTPLEDSFGVNNVALVNGEPATLGLKDMLQIFLDHRTDVVTKRTQNRLDKREKRLHLVEGLLKALLDIDEVIATIRRSPDAPTAQSRLMKKFKVDEIQADYILGLQLRRLTKFDQVELGDEKKRLEKEIKELREILDNPEVMKKLIGDELVATKKLIDSPRRTLIAEGDLATHREKTNEIMESSSVEVADEPRHLAILASGNVVRSAEPHTVGGRGKLDPIVNTLTTTTRSKVIFVTNKGKGYRVDVLHLSDGKNDAKAVGVPLDKGERIIAVAPDVDKNTEGVVGIAMATRDEPAVKIVAMDFPVRSDEFEVMPVGKGDEILSARYITAADEAEFVFITSDSSLLHFPASKVRPQGRTGGGVASMKVAEGAKILGFFVITKPEWESASVLTVAGGQWKNTPVNVYPGKGRATGGVRSMKFLKGTTALDAAFVGVDILAVDESGKRVDLPALDQRRDGSGTKREGAMPVVFGRK